MSLPIIDYNLGASPIANPDGTMPALPVNFTQTDGPGATLLGTFANAFRCAGNAWLPAKLTLAATVKKLALRLSFRVDNEITGRQTLVSANGFSLYLERGQTGNDFVLTAEITDGLTSMALISTYNHVQLPCRQWFVADLVFDTDTWALFIDGRYIALQALPGHALPITTDQTLVLGADRNGLSNKLKGDIAAVKIFVDDIPEDLENNLDAQRNIPEWFISMKYNQVKRTVLLGAPVGAITYNDTLKAYVQVYDSGQISFNETLGNAVEMHGAIYQFYKTAAQALLGTPVTDELPAKKTGARKNAFANGAIYWSTATGAVGVLRESYIYYEQLGESGSILGLPISAATAIAGGTEQKFEGGILISNNANGVVAELPTDFVTAYRMLGGIGRTGFPISGTKDILNATRQAIGRRCDFEKGVLYFKAAHGIFSSATGVHFVPAGKIADAYFANGGTRGFLGFPTADPKAVVLRGRTYMCGFFQGGVVVDTGADMFIRKSFSIYLDTVSTEETESMGRGENDLYMNLTITKNSVQVVKKRFPDSGSHDGRNDWTGIAYNTPVNFSISHPEDKIHIELDVWESDAWNSDDHPGTFKYDLDINNLWGFLDAPDNQFKSAKFGGIKFVRWSIKPVEDPNIAHDFWKLDGDRNPSTPEISRAQFARAFRDIDSNPEWYDVGDWLKILYMTLTKHVAATGNCFGFCTEAIYAGKDQSPFSNPLSQYHQWDTIKDDINIKQCYQLGDSFIRWFANQFIHGMTSNPKEVFRQSRASFQRGDNPVICVAQNYLSGGSKHCILPVSWDDRSKPWKMGVFDPNVGGSTVTFVEINPDNNSYVFKSGSKTFGSRMLYAPWNVICHVPRTPLLETLALLAGLLGGGVLGAGALLMILAGASAQTESLTDINGNNLDVSNETLGNFSGKFIRYQGVEGSNLLDGELITNLAGTVDPAGIIHKIKGAAGGQFKYGIKQGVNEFGLEGNIAAAEINTIRLERLAAKDQVMKFNSATGKLVNFVSHRRLSGTDTMSVYVKNIPARAGQDLTISASGGMRYLDILHGDTAAQLEIYIETKINNVVQKQSYATRSEGGTRLFLSHALKGDNIKTAAISGIGGKGTKPMFLGKI